MFEFANLFGLFYSGADTVFWACCARRSVLLLIQESLDNLLCTESLRATCCLVDEFWSCLCQVYVNITMLLMSSSTFISLQSSCNRSQVSYTLINSLYISPKLTIGHPSF